ncbi:phenylacetic acid degradation protein PaaY [Hwanghaeella sp.]|uniref:phenylacetic acid degradation protein PaaY n=1 Tax=Hwanghaeella sp. TaxID=2605943 RepID=UPI003CCBFDC0
MAFVYEIDGIRPVVDPTAFVHPTAVLIGDAIVGPGVYVGPGASMRGDFGRLILETGSNLQDNCIMHGFPDGDTVVEEDGHIGHGAVLHGCTVKRNALVGMNSVVMDGAVIGEESIVGAMAFVRAGQIFEPRSLIVGMPARRIRAVTEEEIAWKGEGTRDYQDLVGRCAKTMKAVEPLTEVDPDRPRMPVRSSRPLFEVKKG